MSDIDDAKCFDCGHPVGEDSVELEDRVLCRDCYESYGEDENEDE